MHSYFVIESYSLRPTPCPSATARTRILIRIIGSLNASYVPQITLPHLRHHRHQRSVLLGPVARDKSSISQWKSSPFLRVEACHQDSRQQGYWELAQGHKESIDLEWHESTSLPESMVWEYKRFDRRYSQVIDIMWFLQLQVPVLCPEIRMFLKMYLTKGVNVAGLRSFFFVS